MLDKVTKGKIKRPVCVLIHGVDGVGKTFFGSQAPNPIFLGSERGTDNLDISRFPTPKNWAEVLTAINDLATKDHSFKSLVIDSLDWLEPLLYRTICEENRVESIELACGGYGKGYVEAVRQWGLLKDKLELLRDKKGMNIILIAHSEIVNFNEPITQHSYQRYELKLYKKTAALFREYVDTVLFATYEIFTKTERRGTKTFSDGARIAYTERRPGWDAKNRFGLPLKMPLGFDALLDGIEASNPMSEETLRAKIDGLLEMVADPELRAKVIETLGKAGNDVTRLAAIANRLELRIGDA